VHKNMQWLNHMKRFKDPEIQEFYESTIEGILENNFSLLEHLSHLTSSGFTPVIEGENRVADMMLATLPDLEEKTKDKFEQTALHLACSEGRDYIIKRLLQYGANPNCVDANGAQPLEYLTNFAWRARKDCLASIDLLIKYGANLDNLGNDEASQTALG